MPNFKSLFAQIYLMTGPKLELSLSMVPVQNARQIQTIKPRMEFQQQHPLLELVAIYERATPLKLNLKDNRSGKTIEVEYVIAPRRLMDYVKEGEPYGISVADMIFISDKTPLNLAPIVAFKLFEERFIDPGLDETGRIKHLRSALDSIKLATIMDLPPLEVKVFVDALVTHDPTGIIAADPLIKRYMSMSTWKSPERAKFLAAHHANWRVRHSRQLGGFLASFEKARRHFRDFRIAKADMILNRARDVNPYLLGHFIRTASTVPLEIPFEVDRVMSGPAYALTREICGIDLIRFVQEPLLVGGVNNVVRSNRETLIEKTWRSLVTRIEHGLLKLEGRVDKKIATLRDKMDDITIEVESKTQEVSKAIEVIRSQPEADATADVIDLSDASRKFVVRAKKALTDLQEKLSVLEELKGVVGK